MKKLIAIIAVLTIFSGCITVNKIYPVTKRDTVYVEKPVFGYNPNDRGIDPGFWYTPYPTIPSGPWYPIYKYSGDTALIKSGGIKAWPIGDTTPYITIKGVTDTLKVKK